MLKTYRKIIFIVITLIFVQCTTATGTNVTPPETTVTTIPPTEIKCNTGEELYNSKCVTICDSGKKRNTEGVCSNLYNLKILLGEGSDISFSTVIGAGSIFTNNPPELKRTGYTFTHWLSNGTIVKPPFVLPESDVTLISVWSIKSLKVSYNLDGGISTTILSATTYLYNSTITFASSPSRTGYKFEGWLANGVKYNSNSNFTIPDENVTITAWWSAYYYNLTLNDIISPLSTTSKTLNEATLLRVPNRIGYTFKAWTITGTDTSYAPGSSFTMPSKDVTLTAWWSINNYKLNVLSYDGSNLSSANFDYNSNYTIPNNSIIRTGYTFTAWSGSNGMSYLPGANISFPASDLSLTSLWSINNYRLNFDLAGGVDPSTTFIAATLHFDYRYNFNNTPSRTGYTFVAWTIAGAGATQLFSSSFNIPAMDTTLTAWWSISKYELSFNLMGGNSNDTFSTKLYAYNTTVTLPTPTRTGYDFTGWQNGAQNISGGSSFTISNNNINLIANWMIKNVSVTIIRNDGTPDVTSNKNYGEIIPVPVLSRSGYTLIAWKSNGITFNPGANFVVPENNVTFAADWTVNSNIFTLDNQDGITTQNATFGQLITFNNTPTRLGYTFNNWTSNGTIVASPFPFAMPNYPVTIRASWTANNYNITLDPNTGSINGTTNNVTLTNVTFGTALPTPVLANKTFIGWQTIIGDLNYYTTTIAGNGTLVAAYSKTVDFDGNGLIDISNLADLKKVRFNLAGTSLKESAADALGSFGGCPNRVCRGYELKNDIDLRELKPENAWLAPITSSTSPVLLADWIPIGGDGANVFTAIFNGNGFELSFLYLRNQNRSNVGFFGAASGTSVRIESLGIVNAEVTQTSGNSNSGILVGKFENGIISNCYTKGSISGRNSTGGIVGRMNYSNVTNSYSTANVTINSEDAVGGLIGNATLRNDIRNVYYNGTVTFSGSHAINYIAHGGIVGLAGGHISESDRISISNCFSAATISTEVNKEPNTGSIVGFQYGFSTVNNSCYWDNSKKSKGQGFFNPNAVFPSNIVFSGIGLTTANMQSTSGTYPSNIGSCFQLTSGSYPKLYYSANGVCTNTLMRGQ